jgi:CRP/FNR family transcriptional regulator, cyclic AMP receptor protein
MPTAERLGAFPALAGLTVAQRAVLADLSESVTATAAERLFQQGQPAEHFWLIESGQVRLDTEQPAGERQLVQTLGPGDVLGWSWLVPPYRWRLDATAAEPVSAVRLDAVAVRSVAERDPAFGYALVIGLIGALLPRLHATRARLLDLYGNPRER